MANIFQIVNGKCAWKTHHKEMKDLYKWYPDIQKEVFIYPKDCLFVEAPDIVNDGFGNLDHAWGYREVDDDGNALVGDARFIPPVPGEGEVYIAKKGIIVPEEDYVKYLDEAKAERQNLNKKALADFLDTHPITYTNGKKYGVSMEDQTEIQLNITQYEAYIRAGAENPTLEWHAQHEACEPWTLDNLIHLVLEIKKFIYPWLQKMNEKKAAIYAATTIEEVDAVAIDDYLTDEDKERIAAEEAAKANEDNKDTMI